MDKNFLSYRLALLGLALFALIAAACGASLVCARGTVLFWVLAAIFSAIALLLLASYFFIWKPYCDTTRCIGLIAEWPLEVDRYAIKYPYNLQTYSALQSIKEQIDLLAATDADRRQVQYQALQSQINPHFLYNTLESIRSEALISGLESVAQMCERLASFFRYTISNTQDLVTVDEELQNVRTYFYIQQYRFGEQLRMQVEYDDVDFETIRKCLMPKLTLQPIVENAIIHGVEGKIDYGIITIKIILTEKRVSITVSDDGVGMDAGTLARINHKLCSRTAGGSRGKGGIAINNVNNRIKIMFGEDYGLSVYSTPGAGTDVECTVPRESEQETARREV